MKSWLIERLVKWMTPRLRFIYHNPDLWRYVESQGYHVLPVHFYQPIPDSQTIDKSYRERSDMVGIDWNESEQVHLLTEVFPQFAEEYNQFDDVYTSDDRYYMQNSQFVAHDPHVYYCMIRYFQPEKVVEVGAGFSTLVASQAAQHNPSTSVIAIEPYPRDFIKNQVNGIQHIAQSAQDMDIAFFEELKPNDILFIDSSHVVKTGSDVVYLILEVLPRLQKGVIVHFHDIFLPFDYPMTWIKDRRLFWTEQYLVQAFLTHNHQTEILFANRYMVEYHKEKMKATFTKSKRIGGGSLWLRM